METPNICQIFNTQKTAKNKKKHTHINKKKKNHKQIKGIKHVQLLPAYNQQHSPQHTSIEDISVLKDWCQEISTRFLSSLHSGTINIIISVQTEILLTNTITTNEISTSRLNNFYMSGCIFC